MQEGSYQRANTKKEDSKSLQSDSFTVPSTEVGIKSNCQRGQRKLGGKELRFLGKACKLALELESRSMSATLQNKWDLSRQHTLNHVSSWPLTAVAKRMIRVNGDFHTTECARTSKCPDAFHLFISSFQHFFFFFFTLSLLYFFDCSKVELTHSMPYQLAEPVGHWGLFPLQKACLLRALVMTNVVLWRAGIVWVWGSLSTGEFSHSLPTRQDSLHVPSLLFST